VYITDIHEPTLANAAYNARLNGARTPTFTAHAETPASESAPVAQKGSSIPSNVLEEVLVADATIVRVSSVSWQDFGSFPEEKVDVLLGSDLVYDQGILTVLVPAVVGMLKLGKVIHQGLLVVLRGLKSNGPQSRLIELFRPRSTHS
jgi:predicted nicotinamide N-methyase